MARPRVPFQVRAQAVSAERVDTAPVRLTVPPRRSAPMPQYPTVPHRRAPRLLPLRHPRACGWMAQRRLRRAEGLASVQPRRRATGGLAFRLAHRCSSRCTWRAARWTRKASSTHPAATCSCSCILDPCGRRIRPGPTRLFVPYICQHRRGRALVVSNQAQAPLCSGWAANFYTASHHVYACSVPPQLVFGVG